MIRLGTVGTSTITAWFLNACKLTQRYRLVACCSRDAARGAAFRAEFGFMKSYQSPAQMALDPDIDAVYIATPNALHVAQSKLFLEHGKHVICEKPITTSAQEYSELLQLAQRNGLIYMEAMISRYSPGRAILKDALSEIGRIAHARIDYSQRSSRYDAFMAGSPVNIFDMSLAAGTLMDLGVYCIYGALDLLGMPENIMAAASILHNGADGSGSAILTYPDYLATLTYSKIGQSAAGTEIIGDQGVIRIGSISQYGDIHLIKAGEDRLLYPMPTRDVVMSGEANCFADFVENLEQHQQEYGQVCTLTRQVQTCMDAIKTAAQIHYPIP